MSRANWAEILALDPGGNGDLGVADAAVEVGEQRGGIGPHDSSFDIGSGETADGFERAPGGLDKNLSFVCAVMHGNSYAEKAFDLAKFGQNIFGEMLKILRQLRFGSASGPMTMDAAC